jgi:hypothetical protein
LFASSTTQTIPKGAIPTGTVNPRPTFAAPDGGSGSSQSSQPPMQQTPALQPTGQSSPTPGNGGALNVQITSIPSQVINGNIVNVGVNTSQPGVSVLLVLHYSVQGGRNTAGPQITDNNGDATIQWFVLVNGIGFGKKSVQAFVYAVATDQNGQQVRSQTQIVQVQTRGMGG